MQVLSLVLREHKNYLLSMTSVFSYIKKAPFPVREGSSLGYLKKKKLTRLTNLCCMQGTQMYKVVGQHLMLSGYTK